MIAATLRRVYHALVPLALRRAFHLKRFSGSRRARADLWRRTGGRVAAGPFKGMRLAGTIPEECYGPDLIGSFECDVHEWLEDEIARGWTVVVNIGSNAGFYSTGMAMRMPAATVHAFEIEPTLRADTKRSAERNEVGARVHALGAATPSTLSGLAVPDALVVCDCEGAEHELLDPALVPWLARSAMLVELHDFAAPGTTDVLRQRFAATHDIAVVEQQPRDVRAWAARAGVSERDAIALTDEPRPWKGTNFAGRWMLLRPR